ncbi:hypothetical protein DFH05DRAFT_1511419 [Lentinula detonsa]|uniref:Beta-glucuronidase C-terminal domain-containing protein n=1 Tax=Lentinula detonsa TaxID=2804962 RepID=A0A9W8NSD7_9AGAR|nr:hypothetical protein DFH05DRAFT_1511419 [Lentinula detonsa]
MKQLSPCITCLLGTLPYFVHWTTAQVLITPPMNPSEYASKPVANNFVSLSIAIHFFQDYTCTGSDGELPNIFSRNLLSSLKESTSFAPEIRIGGTSADRTTYMPSQNTTISQVSGANGIPLNVTLNQRWFQQCFDEANFPSGIKFIFDLPLMRNDSLAIYNMIQGAQWALEAIGGNRLEAFEIGKEEDLYVRQGVVPATWTVVDYAARWKTFNSAVVQGALIPFGLDLTKKWFQGLAFSGLGANLAWTTETEFNADVNDNHTLKSVSFHSYPAGSAPWVNLGNTFMNHTAIVANLSQVKDDIAFLGSSPSTENIVFNLGETNIDFTNLNMDQFGSALWTIDYILYGASLAAWQPVATDNSQPKVRSPWYGLKFAAEAIGSHQGTTQIAPLNIVVSNNISAPLGNTTSDPNQGANTTVSMNTQDVPAQILNSEKISAYAVYKSSLLARIVLINFNEWNSTMPYPHPSAVFRIDLPLKTGQLSSSHSVNTRTLTAPNGASADNDLMFGGIMWNYTTQGLPQRVESVPGTVQVQRSARDGSITVKVGASEAMLINLGS